MIFGDWGSKKFCNFNESEEKNKSEKNGGKIMEVSYDEAHHSLPIILLNEQTLINF